MEPNKTEALTRLGARLREARRARKLTQEAVAQPEFTKSYISAIERGRARPSLRALTLIAGRLAIPVAELLTLDAPGPAHPDLAALDEDCAYQLDHVKLLIHTNQGSDALRLLAEIVQTYGALFGQFSLATRYRFFRLQGAAYVRVNEPDSARTALEHALTLAEQLADPQELYRTRNVLGAAFYQQDLALQALEQHEACFRAIQQGVVRDPHLRLNIYTNLANDYWALQQLEQAIAVYHEARLLLDDVIHPERQAGVYWGLAESYRATGDLDRAKLYAWQALGIAEAGANQAAVAAMSINLAEILIGRDELAAARPLLEQAERILQPLQNPVLGTTLYEVYTLLELRNEALPAAESHAERSLALSETAQQASATGDGLARANAARGRARALRVAALLAERQGRPDLADARFREALAIIGTTEEAETAVEIELSNPDLLQQRGDAAQAVAHYQHVAHARLVRRGPR
jgi:transcriptional regulator with XRE-family HTH domain